MFIISESRKRKKDRKQLRNSPLPSRNWRYHLRKKAPQPYSLGAFQCLEKELHFFWSILSFLQRQKDALDILADGPSIYGPGIDDSV